MVKTHARLHAYLHSVNLPRRGSGAPRHGTKILTADRYLPLFGTHSDSEPYAAEATGGQAGAKRVVSTSPVWSQSILATRIIVFFKALIRPQ
jgi:hypothetical protein